MKTKPRFLPKSSVRLATSFTNSSSTAINPVANNQQRVLHFYQSLFAKKRTFFCILRGILTEGVNSDFGPQSPRIKSQWQE